MHGSRHDRRPIGSISRRLRILLPLGLIATSIWLLVGCLYLPTGENVHLTGSKKDFRRLAGYDAEKKPVVAGRFTRDRIEAVLGRPPYISDSGRRAMYVIHVKTGILIAPLCFTATDRNDQSVGLVLTYDAAGQLIRWQKVDSTSCENDLNGPYGVTAAAELQDRSEEWVLNDANRQLPGPTTDPTTNPTVEAAEILKPISKNAK